MNLEHVLGHEVLSASRMLAGIPGFHFDLDGLKAGGLMGIGHVITMRSEVQKLAHAYGALISVGNRCGFLDIKLAFNYYFVT